MSDPRRNKRRLESIRLSSQQISVPLSREQMRFVEEYLYDLDPKAAAVRAGLDALSGRALLSSVRIQAAIQTLKAKREHRTEIYADEVLRSWEMARRVDYNEFVSVIVPPCRYCWGTNHHYQFTTLLDMGTLARQHAQNQAKLSASQRWDFDTEGGEGYTVLRQPCRGAEWRDMGFEPTSDHSCPECQGVGDTPRLLVRDTRYLSQGARYLYEGATRSKDGDLKLNLRSRQDFDEMVGRHLGLLGASARPIAPADPSRMSDEQLDGVLELYGLTIDADCETVDESTDEDLASGK